MTTQATYYASSASVEWYTPRYIIDGVIAVLEAVDCDPCSNREPYNVPATIHYTQDDDGLIQPWAERVYMNPPYGRALPAWVDKLLTELALGRCTEAITLTPARTDTQWFQGLWQAAAICFMYRRVHFLGRANTRNDSTFPTALAYFGPRPERFSTVFKPLGFVLPMWHLERALAERTQPTLFDLLPAETSVPA